MIRVLGHDEHKVAFLNYNTPTITLPVPIMPLPSNIHLWNPAMRGSYMKGRAAFKDGKTLADCPYEDKRKPNGRLSWSRAFITAWCDGWRDEQRDAAA
jgi:hypothetical protein